MRARLNSKLHRLNELIENKAEAATPPAKKLKQTRSDVDQPKKARTTAARNHSKAAVKKQKAEKKKDIPPLIPSTAPEAIPSPKLRKTEATPTRKIKKAMG